MEEEGKVQAAASCRFEQREKDSGCWLIDLIGKRKDIAATRFLLLGWRKRKGWCCSVGEIK
jgi:hypothetical protein